MVWSGPFKEDLGFWSGPFKRDVGLLAGGGCAFDVLALASEHGSSHGIWGV